MTRPSHLRAFTLIELMIVMSVIALLAAAAAPALGGLTGADARKGAGEIAGTMRWLFDSASVRHATCRMAFSGRTFWAECAPGRTTIERDPEKARAAAERAAEAADEEDGAAAKRPPAGFSAFEDPIVRRRELPGGASFRAIEIDGRDALAGDAPAFVHFFPGGRAQAARVTIADGDHVFTIRLEPFTGHARVSAGVPDARNE